MQDDSAPKAVPTGRATVEVKCPLCLSTFSVAPNQLVAVCPSCGKTVQGTSALGIVQR